MMQLWRGHLKVEDLERKWQEHEEKASKLQKRLDKMKWQCMACDQELPAQSFGAVQEKRNQSQFHSHIMQRILQPGACRYCVDCKDKQRGKAGAAATKKVLIRCTGPCGLEKEEIAFPEEKRLYMRRRREYKDALCCECLKIPACRVKSQSAEEYLCSICGISRKAKDYETKLLNNLIVNNKVYEAKCLLCDRSQLDRMTKDFYQCCACKEKLPSSEFSVARAKSHRAYKCALCERPPCRICGKRPEKVLTNQNQVIHTLQDRKKFRCQECLYPPCAKCKKTPRPDKGSKYHVDKLPSWTCRVCREAA